MSKLHALVCLVPLLAAAGFAGAQAPEEKPAPITVLKDTNPVMYGRSARIRATAEAVDLATRELSVKNPKGRLVTMRVEERVKNLPQVKPGDELVVRYNESVGVELRKAEEGGEVVQYVNGSEDLQPAGNSAHGSGSHLTMAGEIESVSPREKSVTLKGDSGQYVDLYVRDQAVLDSLAAGERVIATYTAAAVVSIENLREKKEKEKEKEKKKKRRN